MKKFYPLVILTLIVSCVPSGTDSSERPTDWIGDWKAEWETPPESYPDLMDMEFYMTGNFIFTDDSLTVKANGYPGCIFNVDTLSHTQSWKVSGDTLFLINELDKPGITYQIKSKEANSISLQLMEDIFVTLSK
ncbi:MAG: hypothetical protein AAF789_08945 [Bacteroidota bacterium]